MSDELLLIINPARVVVDSGGVAEVALQIQNRSEAVDELLVEVLGDAAAWTVVERPQVRVLPEAVEWVQVSIRPPRASHPEAGTIAVGFQVRSTVDPSRSTVEEGHVEVRPFVEIAGEITPRTARGRFSAGHRLRVTNQGNAPVNVSVRAEVEQGDCKVLLPERPLRVDVGARASTRIRVRPSSPHWRGAGEMHSYRLSLDTEGGTPIALDAGMKQLPILAVPLALLVAVALLLGGGAVAAFAKGANPIQTAMRWTGAIDIAPGPRSSPPPTIAADSASQQAQRSGQSGSTAVTPPSQSIPANPGTPSPTSRPTIISTFVPLPPGMFCASLTSVTLTDATSASILTHAITHTLKWTGNGTCGPFSGTITGTYGTFFSCVLPCISHWIYSGKTYQISGVSGTYQDLVGSTVKSTSYKLTLTDGHGNSVTASAS